MCVFGSTYCYLFINFNFVDPTTTEEPTMTSTEADVTEPTTTSTEADVTMTTGTITSTEVDSGTDATGE